MASFSVLDNLVKHIGQFIGGTASEVFNCIQYHMLTWSFCCQQQLDIIMQTDACSKGGSENQLAQELLAHFYSHISLFPIPPILALKAIPTVQWELFAAAATSPAQRVPCLQGEHTHSLSKTLHSLKVHTSQLPLRLQSAEECIKLGVFSNFLPK